MNWISINDSLPPVETWVDCKDREGYEMKGIVRYRYGKLRFYTVFSLCFNQSPIHKILEIMTDKEKIENILDKELPRDCLHKKQATTSLITLLDEEKEKEAGEFGVWMRYNYGDITGMDMDWLYKEFKKD